MGFVSKSVILARPPSTNMFSDLECDVRKVALLYPLLSGDRNFLTLPRGIVRVKAFSNRNFRDTLIHSIRRLNVYLTETNEGYKETTLLAGTKRNKFRNVQRGYGAQDDGLYLVNQHVPTQCTDTAGEYVPRKYKDGGYMGVMYVEQCIQISPTKCAVDIYTSTAVTRGSLSTLSVVSGSLILSLNSS